MKIEAQVIAFLLEETSLSISSLALKFLLNVVDATEAHFYTNCEVKNLPRPKKHKDFQVAANVTHWHWACVKHFLDVSTVLVKDWAFRTRVAYYHAIFFIKKVRLYFLIYVMSL